MLTRAQLIQAGLIGGVITARYIIKKTLDFALGGGQKKTITLTQATKITNQNGDLIGYSYAGSDGKYYFDNGSQLHVWTGNEWTAV